MAVSISALQFGRNEFAALVLRALRQNGLDASLLELELSENVLMANAEKSARQMERARKIKVKVSVDGFGTGIQG